MEYMGGKEFWHQRFAARSDAPMQPEAILVEDMRYLTHPDFVLTWTIKKMPT